MSIIDYSLVILFFIGLVSMGFYFNKWVGGAEDHFLAGRQLPPFILAAVVAATNINLYNYVGYAGIAYKTGVSIVWQEWTGLMCMVTVGMFIHPLLWRLKISTVPEFLELRFNKPLRAVMGVFMILRGAFWMGVILYLSVTIAIGVTGIDNRELWVFIFSIITLFVIAFTAMGGAWSVAMTDVSQFMLLLLGTLIIIPIVMPSVGWVPGLRQVLAPETFNLMPQHGEYNWAFVLAIWLLGIQYCSTNNDLVVRALGASSPRTSAIGWVLSGAVMVPFAYLIVLPGLAATQIFPGLTGPAVDSALPMLLQKYMPVGLLGIVLCGFMASNMSTITGSLNANSVIAAKDLYQSLINKDATSRQLLVFARWATVVIGGMMIAFCYLVPRIGSAVEAYLTVVSMVDMPSFVIFIICGLFIRRVNSFGAVGGFACGIGAGAYCQIEHWAPLTGLPFADTTLISSAATLVAAVAISLVTKPAPAAKLERVLSAFRPSEQETADDKFFHLWPVSPKGRFWMTVHLLGLALFFLGIGLGAFAVLHAGAVSAIGMIIFLVGAVMRLLHD